MQAAEPLMEFDATFSSPEATPLPWAEARARLEEAELCWVSTV